MESPNGVPATGKTKAEKGGGWEEEGATPEQHNVRHEQWKKRRNFWITEARRLALEEEIELGK